MKAAAQHAVVPMAAAPQRPPIQRKAQLGPVSDPLEREADRVAEAVVAGRPVGAISSANSNTPQRKCAECAEDDERTLQRKETGEAAVTSRAVDAAINAVSYGGNPLTAEQRTYFEPRFDRDLSHVRLHVDHQAAAAAGDISARAYTFGNHIAFSSRLDGQGGPDDRLILAHEIAHVIQQDHHAPHVSRWANCKPARLSLEDCPERQPGEVQRARSGPMVFLPGLKDPITGDEGVAIANFDIGSAAIKGNLHDTIYWKQFLKRIEANQSQWTILGLTDCQGSEHLNHKLRKERALAVFNLLPPTLRAQITSVQGAPMTECLTDNTNSSDRTLNRSVVLMLDNRNVQFKAEEVPANFVCGPNVTDQIERAVSQLKADFDGLTDDQQEEVCGTLNSLLVGSWTWDIIQLYHENNAWIHQGYRPACATKGANCGETVQVGDQCYYSGTANYVVFGVMCRLCQQNLEEDEGANYDEDHMLELIDAYKGPGVFMSASGNYAPSRKWAQAGYHGWPNGGMPPAGDRPNCLPRCPTKYSGESFKVRWCPHLDPGDQCMFWSRRRRSRRL